MNPVARPAPVAPVATLSGLRIGLDARLPCGRPPTGVETYRTVLRRTLEASGAQVWLLTDAPGSSASAQARPLRWLRAAPRGGRRAETGAGPSWTRRDLFREAQVYFDIHREPMPVETQDPPDLMHWSYPLPLVMRGTRNVYTLHDLIPLEAPRLSPIDGGRHGRLVRGILGGADHIVTVSEASRRAILRELGLPPSRVTNTTQAAPEPEDEAGPPPGFVSGSYFLFCGSVEPRKNIARLIAAHRLSGVAAPLVIAGPDGWRASAELAGADARVVRLPWLERSHLSALQRHALALVFPSLAEGFGLPVLEAMRLGTPVIASDRGAVAELAGEAAFSVDPADLDQLAGAFTAVASRPLLRGRLRRAGLARADHFSPRRYGERLAAAYARVLQQDRTEAR